MMAVIKVRWEQMLARMRDWDPHITGGQVKWCRCTGKVWRCLKKLNRVLYGPAIPLPGRYQREFKTYGHSKICPPMFIEALFIIAKEVRTALDGLAQRLERRPANQRVSGSVPARCTYQKKKMWYIHTMEHNSVIKRNKVLLNATAWMNLETLC